jgi:hypothetical protein
MSGSYFEITAERRVGDKKKKAKYNTHNNEDGRKDYYANIDEDSGSKTVQIGKSINKKKWQIKNIKDDTETMSEDDFDKHDYKTTMSDFNIDATSVFEHGPDKKTTTKKKPAKKKPAKKKGGNTKEGGKASKKTTTKKKASKKKASKKKASKKKASKKKASKKKASKKKKSRK